MRAYQFLPEIERLAAADYAGGKDVLSPGRGQKHYKKLPGNSGFVYSIQQSQGDPTVQLWDPQGPEARPGVPQLIGKLSLERNWGFPIPGALQVTTITVDEDYRGQGVAKALYGIVLTIMKRPLLAGDSQTPGGRQNWVSLSRIPGVEVKGYIVIDREMLDPNNDHAPFKKSAEKKIDTIMGRLGGQYIGPSLRGSSHYFAFDVEPNTSGSELQSYVKQNLARVYDEGFDMTSGLYAVWSGN